MPLLIEQHQLPYQSLTRQTDNYQVLSFVTPPAEREAGKYNTLLPEEYLLNAKPYFVHYRKGARKGENKNYQLGYGQEEFTRDINAWLQRLQNVTAN